MYRILLLSIVLFVNLFDGFLAKSQIQIKVNSISAYVGGTTTIEFEILNQLPINGMEFSIILPDGVDITDNLDNCENKISFTGIMLNSRNDFKIIHSDTDNRLIKVLMFSPSAQNLKEDKTIIKFDVFVDETCKECETITISGIKIPALINDSTLAVYCFDDINIGVNNMHSTPKTNINFDECDYLYGIDGKRINEVRSNNIYIRNGKKYLTKD